MNYNILYYNITSYDGPAPARRPRLLLAALVLCRPGLCMTPGQQTQEYYSMLCYVMLYYVIL